MSADVDLDEVYKKVHCEPQNPRIDPDKNYEVVEAKDGVDFDLEAAKKSLELQEGNGCEHPAHIHPGGYEYGRIQEDAVQRRDEFIQHRG